jgi:polysaccharide export outer membrane protein
MSMTKLKTIAVCMLLIGAGAYGLSLAVSQIEVMRRGGPEPASAHAFTSAKSKAQPPVKLMKEYVIEPPDLVLVELLEGLPGRPISGERLVRPNGSISLGWYGDVQVAGLTVPEVKERIVQHLRKYLMDDTLGLIKTDDETGEWIRDANGEPVMLDPKESDRVFVDVTAYNSKYYYVQGEFQSPGKLPVTGHERVLDAIDYSGGLTSNADHDQVFLFREPAGGGPVQTIKIDVDEVLTGDDLSTNFHLQPGDKLVARRRGGEKSAPQEPVPPPSTIVSKAPADSRSTKRSDREETTTGPAAGRPAQAPDMPAIQRLETRIGEMERKLDEILDSLHVKDH